MMQRQYALIAFVICTACSLAACDSGERSSQTDGLLTSQPEPERVDSVPKLFGQELEPAHYGLEGMVEERFLRVLVGYSHTHYFMDGLRIRGITAENLKHFDPFLQAQLGLPPRTVSLLPMPVARDEMIDFLVRGLGDIAMGNITITDERASRVDFSIPIYTDVSEIIVHGPDEPPITDLQNLSGRTIHVRRSSSFYESIAVLNHAFAERGLEAVKVVEVDELLQTEDILELVNAGAIGITVADSHMAAFWSDVFDNLVVREDLALNSGREIAWAIRKGIPGLKPIVDRFIAQNREGTLVGNVLFKRYLQDNHYVHNASASADRARLLAMADLFRRFSQDYDFDWLLIAAQAYQESRLIQSLRSGAGAVGVMQLLPSTAANPPINIPEIDQLEANIHAGHKYLRHIADTYFDEPEIDELNRHLFAFAAYNAGPTRISRLRRRAAERGLDPNQWFGEVERVVAEQVGMEPVTYVRNIFKYYATYKLMQSSREIAPGSRSLPNATDIGDAIN